VVELVETTAGRVVELVETTAARMVEPVETTPLSRHSERTAGLTALRTCGSLRITHPALREVAISTGSITRSAQ